MAGCDGEGARAMTEMQLAVTDPEAWKIASGKLCVNCSREADVKWSMDISGHIKEGRCHLAGTVQQEMIT
jgi:hypothetical protein